MVTETSESDQVSLHLRPSELGNGWSAQFCLKVCSLTSMSAVLWIYVYFLFMFPYF